MKKIIISLIISAICGAVSAQQKVTGYVYDTKTSETIPGANISYKYKGELKGVLSDSNGYYTIDTPADAIILIVSSMGYETGTYPLVIAPKQNIEQNIFMNTAPQLLDEVVVSVGRFEQKLSEITVSMSVLKAEDISKQNPKDLRSVLNTIPGVDVTDKQPSIRSGSGWTYGVGSRSQILLDGMSVLSPGVGEINWNIIPMENIEQVEVIKGASSVLYGSSALNGIINVRTARPGLTPQTNVSAYAGIYGSPKNEGYEWWDKDFWKEGKYDVEPIFRDNLLSGVRNPIYNGVDFSHTRRIGNFDVSGGLNLFADEGYRNGDYNKRTRVGGNLTYHSPDVKYLNYGFNVNYLSSMSGDFFIWRSEKEAYNRSPLTNMGRESNTFFIDPFINYTNAEKGISHKLKGRFYYRNENIYSHPNDKNLIEIVRDMGVDGNSVNGIIDLIGNPGQLLPDLLPPILNNDLQGTADAIIGLGNKYFPNATQADYVDLISWVMNNGIPTSSNDIPQWALNAISPKKPKVKPDDTYSYYLDYQFSKKINTATLTAGMTYEHVKVNSIVTDNHNSDNVAGFFQYDQKFFDKLNVSLGTRFEYYRVDSHYREAETGIFGSEIPVKPIFRGGLNYQLADYSFLRASFGQGYRYPSMTEKFVIKNIGGVGAYPNNDLKAESGYNAEIGLKQGYKFGPFMGFFDIAGFYTYYKDMIEFDFGLINTGSKDYPFITNLRDAGSMILGGHMPAIGVKFNNVNRAKIYGIDASFNGYCDINPSLKLLYTLGYVYTEPRDVNVADRNRQEEANTDILAMKSKSNTSKYLKYRQKHQIKGTFDFQWERFSIGTNLMWKSKTLAADYFIIDERRKLEPDAMDYVRSLIFGNLDEYWKEHNKNHFVLDLRMGVDVTKSVGMQFQVSNLLNKEYSNRPMDVAAPRTFMVKLNLHL